MKSLPPFFDIFLVNRTQSDSFDFEIFSSPPIGTFFRKPYPITNLRFRECSHCLYNVLNLLPNRENFNMSHLHEDRWHFDNSESNGIKQSTGPSTRNDTAVVPDAKAEGESKGKLWKSRLLKALLLVVLLVTVALLGHANRSFDYYLPASQ